MKIPYKCNSPECRAEAMPLFFLEEKVQIVCPECSSDRPTHLTKLQTIHLLIPEKNGPLKGQHEDFNYACDAAKALGKKNRHLTGELSACTCQECIEVGKTLEQPTE